MCGVERVLGQSDAECRPNGSCEHPFFARRSGRPQCGPVTDDPQSRHPLEIPLRKPLGDFDRSWPEMSNFGVRATKRRAARLQWQAVLLAPCRQGLLSPISKLR